MDTANWNATEIAAAIAFGGVLVSASLAHFTASRSVYVNAITASRIKWMENVRQLLVSFRQLHRKVAFAKSQGQSPLFDDVYEVTRLHEELKLTLGQGLNEKNILKLTFKCIETASDYPLTLSLSSSLAKHARWLLETE